MKYLILLSFVGCFIYGCGGSYPIGTVKTENIYEYTDKPKSMIYNKTIKWIALNTDWSKSVIDMQDSTTGTIVMKARVWFYDGVDKVTIMNTFSFDMKDNKLRVTIFNDSDEYVSKDSRTDYKKYLDKISKKLNEYIVKNDDF